MKAKKIPAPRRAGTRVEKVPQWVVEALRRDPELLRDVAVLVKQSRDRASIRRR